jgi:hypothetical protein
LHHLPGAELGEILDHIITAMFISVSTGSVWYNYKERGAASDRRVVIVQIGIETFREKFDCDFDPDFERAEKCCTARI